MPVSNDQLIAQVRARRQVLTDSIARLDQIIRDLEAHRDVEGDVAGRTARVNGLRNRLTTEGIDFGTWAGRNF